MLIRKGLTSSQLFCVLGSPGETSDRFISANATNSHLKSLCSTRMQCQVLNRGISGDVRVLREDQCGQLDALYIQSLRVRVRVSIRVSISVSVNVSVNVSVSIRVR